MHQQDFLDGMKLLRDEREGARNGKMRVIAVYESEGYAETIP